MRQASKYEGKKLFSTKVTRKGEEKIVKLGKIRRSVYSEDGSHLVGYIVHQPDIAGMVKRPDLFVAFDVLEPYEKGFIVSDTTASFDDAARERLDIDWDRCVMWVGMDVVTTNGKELGYISDAEYDEKTGEVSAFIVSDGNAAEIIVGNIKIPWRMVKRYEDGSMIVAAQAAKLEPSGGAAGVAGEGVARAKQEAAKAGKKAEKVAANAFDKGTHGLGKLIGKAKNAVSDAMADDTDEDTNEIELENYLVETPPAELPAPKKKGEKIKTYAPKKKSSKKTKKKSSKGMPSAQDVGKHLGKVGGMFQAFKDEYDKASK